MLISYKNIIYIFNQKSSKIALYVVSAVNILFNSIGILGAYKQHYYITILYSILIQISLLANIYTATKAPVNWFSLTLNLIILIITVTYVRDLRVRQIQSTETKLLNKPCYQTIAIVPDHSFARIEHYSKSPISCTF